MNTNCEVISAFLDDEPVDAEELSNALATVDGRRFLIDTIALRCVTRSHDAVAVVVPLRSRFGRRLAVAAAILLAAVASFQLGQRHGLNATVKAPEPTRVIAVAPAWQEDSSGGGVR
jgi:hypothetical protein